MINHAAWFIFGIIVGWILGAWYELRKQNDYLKILRCHLNGLKEALMNAHHKEPDA